MMKSQKTDKWKEEFSAAFITITNQKTWKDGKPVFYGKKYPTVFNALQNVVFNIISQVEQQTLKRVEELIENEKVDVRPEITTWYTHGTGWEAKQHNKTLSDLLKKLNEKV